MVALIKFLAQLLWDFVRFVVLVCRPRRALVAENLFLRRQLALYKERGLKPRKIDAATRASLAYLARKDPAGGYEWAFVAPEADLFDTGGNRIGRHYAGPHWEATDGSKILGAVKERADAPAADAIPWLLLTAKSVGPEGSFSKVTSVQRVGTVGGVAPKAGCSQAAAGTPARINYTADYYFLTRK